MAYQIPGVRRISMVMKAIAGSSLKNCFAISAACITLKKSEHPFLNIQMYLSGKMIPVTWSTRKCIPSLQPIHLLL